MMIKKLFAAVVAALTATQGVPRGRQRVCDAYGAFPFRMPAGFPGDVNRTHPASIEPLLVDEDDPVELYGNMGVLDSVTHGLRQILVADASDVTPLLPWGAVVRPYPGQQQTGGMAAAIGIGVPPVEGIVDVMRMGYIMVKLNAGVTAPVKGGRVFIWAAATAGDHILGGYETEASAGNTVQLDPRYTYNGPPDAEGVTELIANF